MDDHQVLPNGFMMDDRRFEVPLWPLFTASNPDPSSIEGDSWDVAEETIQEMLCCIHPSLESEEKRKDVIEYVQKLIRATFGCEVFPYGSVPLKTYLPDGDIDLTALSTPYFDGDLAHKVLGLLQKEEQKENTDYEVKDTQFIDAEVKLVKCLVQDIVIDISFNQLGGLCSLCFLEQIDHIVGKDHLFKRSIILIKAWCYYESRILGAHHGLISTYALETLVLYIFNLFHSSLNGPLAVLYRFLDYFSKFDWDNCCVSLKGPVLKASLPDIVVQMPPNLKDKFLLSEEFLRNCLDMFSVPSKATEADVRSFPVKHLNIIDPLKENNNLGRSVHRGNYYRIRSALKYGARKLGRILVLPPESIADEMKRFFSNTIERHACEYANLSSSSTSSEEETAQVNSWTSDLENFLPGMGGCNGGVDTYLLGLVSEKTCSIDGTGSGSGSGVSGIVNDSPHCSSSSSVVDSTSHSLSRLNCYATPYHYSGGSCTENGKWKNGKEKPAKLVVDEKVCRRDLWMEHSDKYYHLALDDNGQEDSWSEYDDDDDEGSSYSSGCCSSISSPRASTLSEVDFRIPESPEETLGAASLPELTGDYDNHIRSLTYGQCCNGYASSAKAALPNHPSFPCPQETYLYFPNVNGYLIGRSSRNEAPAAAVRQQRSSTSENPPVLTTGRSCDDNNGGHSSQSQVLSNGHFQLGRGEENHPAGTRSSNSHLNGFCVPPFPANLEFGSLGEAGLDAYCGQTSSLKIKNSSIGSK